MKSSPTSEASAFTDFFGGAGSVAIESRDANGAQADARERHAVKAIGTMGALRSFAVAAALSATALASFGATATAPSQEGLPELTQAAAGKLARQAIGPNIRHLDMLSITDRVIDGSPGPTAQVRDGKSITCTLTINDINAAAATMAMSKEPDRVARMREFIVVHEAAHCDHFGSVAAAKRSASEGKPAAAIAGTSFTYGDLVALGEQMEASTAKRFGKGFAAGGMVAESMGELYADAKAMLVLADKHLGSASTPQAQAEGLKAFNAHADDIIAFRSANKGNDFVHDSSTLIQNVKAYVNAKAATPEGLEELRKEALDPNKTSGVAMKWMVGEALQRSEGLTRHAAQEIVSIVAKGDLPRELKYLKDAEPQMAQLLKSGERLGYGAQDFSGQTQAMVVDFTQSYQAMKAPQAASADRVSTIQATLPELPKASPAMDVGKGPIAVAGAAVDPNNLPAKLRGSDPVRDAILNSNLMQAANFTGRLLTTVFGFQAAAEKELAKLHEPKKMKPR